MPIWDVLVNRTVKEFETATISVEAPTAEEARANAQALIDTNKVDFDWFTATAADIGDPKILTVVEVVADEDLGEVVELE